MTSRTKLLDIDDEDDWIVYEHRSGRTRTSALDLEDGPLVSERSVEKTPPRPPPKSFCGLTITSVKIEDSSGATITVKPDESLENSVCALRAGHEGRHRLEQRCVAGYRTQSGKIRRCCGPTSHTGMHETDDGERFVPLAQLATTSTASIVSPLPGVCGNRSNSFRVGCDLDPGHAGAHVNKLRGLVWNTF